MKTQTAPTNAEFVVLPPAKDPGRLSNDVRALLKLIDRFHNGDLEFSRFQLELWDDDGPLLIAALREPTSPIDPAEFKTATWQLTGEILRWDFDQERWDWREPLFRFYSLDELSAWLHERFGPSV